VDNQDRRRRTTRLEVALWTLLGVLAFLAKDDPRLVYPDVLYLFVAMLLSNLGTSLSIRLAPNKTWIHAATLIAGFASIAGVQEWSGGHESTLWVLYLMPLFTAAILLEGGELALTAVGACLSNAALYVTCLDRWDASLSFELALKTGMLACSAGALWFLARAEREAEKRIVLQRREIEDLEETARATAAAWERERGLHTISASSARAAHDLATPLMVVRSYARLHLDRGVDDPALSRDLERIERAAAFCQELSSGLLAKASETAAPKRLSTVIDAAVSLAEPILRSRNVEVRSEAAEELCVAAAPQDLERILLNLLGNAAKAMSNGGQVQVSARRDERGAGQSAVVTIDDDGPGIPAEVLARLFQPFTTTGGTGLGLYLSREAARRLGGELAAENRPGGGARFTLSLPLASGSAVQTAGAAAA
jgi:signal transduction histidine kinase